MMRSCVGARPVGGAPTAPVRVLDRRRRVARPAQHLLDLAEVIFFAHHHRSRVLLESHVLVRDQRQQLAVLRDAGLLVLDRLLEDVVDVVLVRLQQLADLQRRVAAEAGDVLAGLDRVLVRLGGLVPEPLGGVSLTSTAKRIFLSGLVFGSLRSNSKGGIYFTGPGPALVLRNPSLPVSSVIAASSLKLVPSLSR